MYNKSSVNKKKKSDTSKATQNHVAAETIAGIPKTKANEAIAKSNNINKQVVFTCVMCKQEFSKHCDLVTHFRQHGSNEIDIRGRAILDSTLLKHPSKSTSLLELIECEWCSEVFHNISKAIEHKFRKHRYESTNYFCKICGKLFPLKIALKQHERVEHRINGNPDKTFTDSLSSNSTKTTTATVISSQDEFKCQLCTAKFENEHALKFHEKCVHQLEKRLLMPTVCPPPSKKIKLNNADEVISVYYCHLCGSEYVVKFNLRKHLEDHHTEEERSHVPNDGFIVCKACEAIFYNKKAYDTHNINHRPDDLYVTSEEQRQNIVARVDLDFDVRRVPANIEKFIPNLKCNSNKRSITSSTSTSLKTVGMTHKSFEKVNSQNNGDEDSDLSPLSNSSNSSGSSDNDK